MYHRHLCTINFFLLVFFLLTTITQAFASETIQARLQVDFALNVLELEKIAILYDTDDYGKGLAESAKSFLEEDLGVEVVSYESFVSGDRDFSAMLVKIRNSNAEVVIFCGNYTEAAIVVSQMPQMDMDTIFVGSDKVKNDSFILLAGDSAEGAYLTGPNDGSNYGVFQVQNGTFVEVYNGTEFPTPPIPPNLSISTFGTTVEVVWDSIPGATGYTLYYAPSPYTGPETIGSIDMGTKTSISADLWYGASYYVAVRAKNENGESDYSNIGLFTIE